MENNLVNVFTGSEIEILLLKEELESNGIPTFVRDGYSSGLMAGFYGGSQSSIELLISESDQEKANPIIREFMENRELDTQ